MFDPKSVNPEENGAIELSMATLEDIATQLALRGLHGIVIADDGQMSGSDECGGAVIPFGHPVFCLGQAVAAVGVLDRHVSGLGRDD